MHIVHKDSQDLDIYYFILPYSYLVARRGGCNTNFSSKIIVRSIPVVSVE